MWLPNKDHHKEDEEDEVVGLFVLFVVKNK